tara:strand:+ start:1280 stop:1588 length:309 start_codon:yes stop_codon:yes gene_type:complete
MMKFLTVDKEVATLENNKVVSPGSRFDGMDVKTNEDIEKIFGVRVGPKDLSPYMKPQMPMNMPNAQTIQPMGMQRQQMSQPQLKSTPMNLRKMLLANLTGLI